ncbi:MAG: hypothetical protein EOP88_24625 [Verrucomicrobiaceae bacterium]|nr:MAG: hypothetical protein EOP88_24625 [Verrucomicrobiaceae bacterium]
MKKTPAFAASCLLTLALPSFADTFTLKDGTKLEAKVLSEDTESYSLEVQVTKSIKDERKVLKSEVVEVQRERLDQKAFEAIAKFTPTPDLMTEDEYAVQIAAVDKFLKAYPQSTKAKDAKVILDTLRAEVLEVGVGGVKFGGKIISKEDYQANAYDLDARVLEAKIRKLGTEGQTVAALRAFADFDRDFRTSLSYGALTPFAKQLIQNHVSESQQFLATLDARLKERQTGLARMVSEDRSVTDAAIKEQDAAIEARYKSEKEARQVWVTTSPFHKASLEDASRFGQTELARVSAVKTELGVDGGKAYRELYTAVKNGSNAATIAAAVTSAKTALVPTRYSAPLEAEAKDRK